MDQARIDVVVTAFNAESTIASAVASLQRQTFHALRIIVVDDGSTDRTPQILAGIAATEPRMCVVRQPNRGIVAAANAGLAQCTAELVARLDADDIAATDRLQQQLDWLDAHPDCVAVSGEVRHIDQEGGSLGTVSRFPPPEAADLAWVPAKEPYLMHTFLLARRATLQALGGYRHLCASEDSDLCWRMQEIGKLHNLDAVLGDYRLHAASVSGASLRNGRIMAIESQRASLSAARRRRGERDLDFLPETASRYRAATSLAELLEIGREGLLPEEKPHFDAAVAGKLLELAAYRPYELQLEDCRFIRSALDRYMHCVVPANRAVLARMCSGTAARLLHQGEMQRAAALAPPRAYLATLSRLALRMAMPAPARRRLREVLSGRREGVQVK